jgi:hypothetical protein
MRQALLISLLALLLLLAACSKQQPIGPLGGIHTHADFKVYLDGKAVDFSKQQYMVREKYVHVEDMNGNVVHFHATGVTIGEFFRTLGMRFTSECFVMNKQKYCTGEGKTLKFYVNGEPNDLYGDYLASDLDKLLISYGPADEDVTEQLASITNYAKAVSGKQMDLSKI